jgi:hypothetical protein
MGMGVLDLIGPDDYPPLAMTCPRCGAETQQRFSGPCAGCVRELRVRMASVARDVDTEYEPKMNVTPNAVALKDD